MAVASRKYTLGFSFLMLLVSWTKSIDALTLSQNSCPSAQLNDAKSNASGPQDTSRRLLLYQSMMTAFVPSVTVTGGASLVPLVVSPSPAFAVADLSQKRLTFQTLESGVQVADIMEGNGTGDSVVTSTSKVNVHLLGRLLGKQGWIFENSQAAGEDPFRLDLGTGTIIPGLEEGLLGMKPGGRRRIVIPSAVGYTSRSLEPIPREFSNKQRLYTTVMNSERIERERQALGTDLAGVVVFDVELLRFRN